MSLGLRELHGRAEVTARLERSTREVRERALRRESDRLMATPPVFLWKPRAVRLEERRARRREGRARD